MTNNSALYPHKFVANDIADHNGNFAGKSAITTYNGNFVLSDIVNPEGAYLQSYHKVNEDVTTWDNTPDYYFNGMSVVVGHDYGNCTMSLTLPDAISKRNIREFIIYVRYKEATTTITLTDVDGNSVSLPNDSTLYRKAYLCKYVSRAEGNAYWKLVELA